MLDNHDKLFISMRYWLLGAASQNSAYHLPIRALEYAAELHQGRRKDDSPEFSHQIGIAHHIRVLPSLLHQPEALAVAFLHDTPEDKFVGFEEIERLFGKKVATSTELVTKKFRGRNKPYPEYFAEMAQDPIASIVKGADRSHNVRSMNGAGWTAEKRFNYGITEVDQWFLPMLKTARRRFPEQETAYEALKKDLESQRDLIRLALRHEGYAPKQEDEPEADERVTIKMAR